MRNTDKIDSFGIPFSNDQKLFKNLALFDFESISVQEDKFCDTDTTAWIGKHVLPSVSISLNFTEPVFLCNSNHRNLVESFVDAFDGLATQSKAQMNLNFLEIENNIKCKLNQIFSTFIQRYCGKETVVYLEDGCIEE